MDGSVGQSNNTESMGPQLGVDGQIPPFSEQNQENNRNQQNINLTQGHQNNGSSKTSIVTKFVRQNSKPTTTNAAPCRAYEAAELYRRRKEFKLKQIQQEEERLRKVKPKPMPNFKAIHSKALTTIKEPSEGSISPETPKVLRRGLAMMEKHNQKIKEHELKLSERQPIVARSTKVLTEEPFKPKLEPHHQLKVEPFNLKMNERLTQRKRWDENYQREVALKKEKEQEQKEKEEARTRQVVRQKTIFKARPNPFKKADNLD